MNRFLGLMLALCTVGAPFAAAQVRKVVVPAASPPTLSPRVYRTWTVFTHPRYGYQLPVPPGVRSLGEPEAAAEVTFVSGDGTFIMKAWGGLSPKSPSSLFEAQWRTANNTPNRTINYRRKAGSWFVVSGTERSGREFYEKFTMRGNHVGAFSLTYPRERLREFDAWVAGVEKGFRLVATPDGPPAVAPRLRLEASDETSSGPLASRMPRTSPSQTSDRPKPSTRSNERQEKSESTPPPKTTARSESKPSATEEKPEAETMASSESKELPYGKKVPGKPGFVHSPYSPEKLVDVQDIPSGTKVKCPYTMKIFRVP